MANEKPYRIAVLPGDGIGPEIMAEAIKVLDAVGGLFGRRFEFQHALVGGAAIDATGGPLPEETLARCRGSDAILLGATGGPKWDQIDYARRPEKGLLGLRKTFDLFANLRPVKLFPALVEASSLKREVLEGLDLIVLRELTGDVYFGEPRGIQSEGGEQVGVNTMRYRASEVERIARIGFGLARKRRKRLTSVDKANVLETSMLWRQVVERVAQEYPDVDLSHQYVDNCAMQLVREPRQFDVLLTGNLFGDILSDEAAMLTGSIGMLPSASLGGGIGMYEPIHGSAPEIAGKGVANPLAMILSAAMLLRHAFGEEAMAARVEAAVGRVLDDGYRTADIARWGGTVVGTAAMGDRVVSRLR